MSSDISQIQVGRPPAGVRSTAPVLPTSPAPAPAAPAAPVQPQIAVPPAPSGRGRKVLVLGIGVMILVIAVAIVSSMLGGNGRQPAQPTPTPTPTATLAPRIKTLSAYFGNPGATVTLRENAAADLRNAVLTAQSPAKQAVVMGVGMAPAAFLRAILGTVPSDVESSLGTDFAVLVYGQTESYDNAGQIVTDAPTQTRLALVMEVGDASRANQAIQTWEGMGLASSSEAAFGHRMSRRIVEGFSSGFYREIPLRYWNFPYADQSLDWAIVLASNGKNYLVLTSSREAAFFAIDQLMQ